MLGGLVIGVLVVAGIVVYRGVVDAIAAGPSVPSADHERVLGSWGQPEVWFVADGEPDPGGTPVRLERWVYVDQGVSFDFINGIASHPEAITPDESLADISCSVSPIQLDRGMSRQDVEDELGGPGVELSHVATELGPLPTVAYPELGLVISFHDGHFYTAQVM